MATDEIISITTEDASYPTLLSQCAQAPRQLFVRGNISLLTTFCFAVVGTRKASDYGLRVTADMVGTLARHGMTIVSGLASGIDAAAHRATLAHNGATIAVFGTGLDDASIYPSDHVQLAHEILEHDGLLISEYPSGTRGQQFTFPARNRIISGISRGVLVVEADRKSGSLITAQFALDQNRDVFAVPGSIYWPRSQGANLLIQQGARPVLSATDILESYAVRQDALPEHILSTSDPTQECILALLREHGPLHIDEITTRSGQSTNLILSALTLLELREMICNQGSGIYKLTTSNTP